MPALKFKGSADMEKATPEEISVAQKEGKREVRRKTQFYNLDAIISVVCQI